MPPQDGARGRRLTASSLVALLVTAGAAGVAEAAPGFGSRLGGAEAQGAGSRAITAIHHNPALLGALGGTQAHAAFTGGTDSLWVRRHAIDGSTGEPVDPFAARTAATSPVLGYFAAASFHLDPFAFALGVYDVSSRYRLFSSEALRYHLAPDPEGTGGARCLAAGEGRCPPDGGLVELHQDASVALAWSSSVVQLGLAAHFPMVRLRYAFDQDGALGVSPAGEPGCGGREDPACAERVGFKGYTHWIPVGSARPGFDAALSFGLGITLPRHRGTLGIRYRTFPLRRAGEVVLSGVGLICHPDGGTGVSGLPGCSDASPTPATATFRLPQELALGASIPLGPSRLWRFDANVYWRDECQGGVRAGQCPDSGALQLAFGEVPAGAVTGSSLTRHRGRRDVYGIDLFLANQVGPNLGVTGGVHLASPNVSPAARNAAQSDGWRVGASLATTIRLGRSALLLAPGYGFDAHLPGHVAPGEAAFRPSARTAFDAQQGDLNGPGAREVLEGRASPTNAGRYFGMIHTFTLAIRWAERRGASE